MLRPTSALRLLLAPIIALGWLSCSVTNTIPVQSDEGLVVAAERASSGRGAAAPQLELVATLKIAPIEIDGATLGGLSGLTYDPQRDLFYAISDDDGRFGPPRFFTLRVDLANPHSPTVSVEGWTQLQGIDDGSYGIDFEGIVYTGDDRLFISSEGGSVEVDGKRIALPPFVGEFGLDGTYRRILSLGPRYDPRPIEGLGTRHNLGPEALAMSEDGRYLFAGFESAIETDGPVATAIEGSRNRVVRIDPDALEPHTEWIYPVDPLHAVPPVPGNFSVRGLVEMVTLDTSSFLAMERSFVTGVGSTAEIFRVESVEAEDVSDLASIAETTRHPLVKSSLIDFFDLEIPQDNYEGLSWGSQLADGRRSLLVISDDNFNPEQQSTWLLVFAVD